MGSLHPKNWWVAQKAPLTEPLLGPMAKSNGFLGFPFIRISSLRQSGAGIVRYGDLRTLLSVPLLFPLLGNPNTTSFRAPDYRLASVWPQIPS